MSRFNPRSLLLTLAAPVLALVVAFVVTSLILLAVGDPVGKVWETLLTPPRARAVVNIVNNGAVYYLSAIAVAIGFKMNLFNIGVDGQYRIATFAAAVIAGLAWFLLRTDAGVAIRAGRFASARKQKPRQRSPEKPCAAGRLMAADPGSA